ncbi:phosphotyrosine protein phosphatase I superfamily [Melanogaster broomeanus]|nr:phosphotyrosine protein phosphatase I superfamily [Melanogaster broomeanus]
MTLSVLVVCLGNICRSPMGQARGIDIEVDSAGTGAYHVGEDPDDRSRPVQQHKIPINHSARQKPGGATATVRLWGSYLDNKPIGDPYYGGIDGFEQCYEQCTKLSKAFLDEVIGKD